VKIERLHYWGVNKHWEWSACFSSSQSTTTNRTEAKARTYTRPCHNHQVRVDHETPRPRPAGAHASTATRGPDLCFLRVHAVCTNGHGLCSTLHPARPHVQDQGALHSAAWRFVSLSFPLGRTSHACAPRRTRGKGRGTADPHTSRAQVRVFVHSVGVDGWRPFVHCSC
jgi:hypothetical protein